MPSAVKMRPWKVLSGPGLALAEGGPGPRYRRHPAGAVAEILGPRHLVHPKRREFLLHGPEMRPRRAPHSEPPPRTMGTPP